jgi:hypothetical protein
LCREVVQHRRVVQRPKRRESRRKAIRLELEELFGPAEVLEPVKAEVLEGGASRHQVTEPGGRRGRKHDLAPVGDCRDPGTAVDVETDQANCRLRCLAGVDAHTDPEAFTGWR